VQPRWPVRHAAIRYNRIAKNYTESTRLSTFRVMAHETELHGTDRQTDKQKDGQTDGQTG